MRGDLGALPRAGCRGGLSAGGIAPPFAGPGEAPRDAGPRGRERGRAAAAAGQPGRALGERGRGLPGHARGDRPGAPKRGAGDLHFRPGRSRVGLRPSAGPGSAAGRGSPRAGGRRRGAIFLAFHPGGLAPRGGAARPFPAFGQSLAPDVTEPADAPQTAGDGRAPGLHRRHEYPRGELFAAANATIGAGPTVPGAGARGGPFAGDLRRRLALHDRRGPARGGVVSEARTVRAACWRGA